MELLTLKGNDIYHAFLAGARKLISQKNHLNQINVFPVADGDTGTNMSFLMQTIINEATLSDNLSETLESIANAALNGSRGNSGIIFAEYFNGLYERLKGKAQIKLSDFKDAVKHAIKKAYEAIMNPVEGTILTVLRKAFEINDSQDDFNSYFKTSLRQAKIALKETTEELEVLKKNGVVDAGAEGFTAFLEGINYYLETGNSELPTNAETFEILNDVHEMTVTERFCTEALLINVNRSSQDLKEIFKDDGVSLIISGRFDKMRIHIHTNHPDEFFLKLRQYGQILEQKVDDMIRQQEAVSKDHPRIAIVCDTIADLPDELKDAYQIHQIPMNLLVDDVSYLDKVTISSKTFYELLKVSSHFSSSQPDIKSVERTLGFLSDHYDHILVITVAKELSGTFNVMTQYAKTNPKVTILDSFQNSGGEGLIVYEAAKMANSGKSISEIVSHVQDLSRRTRIYVSVKTLKYMVKQGRVSKVTGFVAKLMNLKPVISLDKQGKGMIKRKALSLKANERQILNLLKMGKVESYAMVHASALKRAQKLTLKIEKLTKLSPLYTTEISPIVAMNAGIGAVAVAVTFQEEVE
ncbi:MAG: DegV family EDD domain-containing protein [Firmicutes bacterium]|nr:DegV family EDD domain-containing protein [Bacillota bacterium]